MIPALQSDTTTPKVKPSRTVRPKRIRVKKVGRTRVEARQRALAAVRGFVRCPHRKLVSAQQVAKALDQADPLTQGLGWKQLFKRLPSRTHAMEALAHSSSEIGWQRLGLPPCLQSKIGPTSSGSIEHPESWTKLLSHSLERRLQPGSEDPRVEEYRRLYQAHQELQKGSLQGKVSETALFLDLKELENKLLPDHLRKAQAAVRSKLLGNGGRENLHPISRVRRFLGAVTAAPASAREQQFYSELSQVALKKPKELSFFAGVLLEEIRRCPASFGPKMQSDFRKALARVTRTHSKTLSGTRAEDCSQDFQSLLRALKRPVRGRGQERDRLEYYRTGLTINGYVRNYTYL